MNSPLTYATVCSGIECWRDAPNTNGMYQVSNFGRVARALTQGNRPCFKIVKPIRGSIVYPTVHLSLGSASNRKRVTIHRLVALAFIPNPDNLPQVNHKDENPCNNRADNLETILNGVRNCTTTTTVHIPNYGTYPEKHRRIRENPIMFRGVRYRSIHDCARLTGHTRQTVSRNCGRISI